MDTEDYVSTDVKVNDTFDPFTQTMTMLLQDGTTTIDVSPADIQYLRLVSAPQLISQGVQLGAAVVLFVAIFLMTSPEKRRSSVFYLNTASLLLVAVRAAFQLDTITGPLYEWYRWKTQAYDDIGNATTISACAEASNLLLTVAILAALYVQVSIVCCNLSNIRRRIINASNAIVITTAVSMR